MNKKKYTWLMRGRPRRIELLDLADGTKAYYVQFVTDTVLTAGAAYYIISAVVRTNKPTQARREAIAEPRTADDLIEFVNTYHLRVSLDGPLPSTVEGCEKELHRLNDRDVDTYAFWHGMCERLDERRLALVRKILTLEMQ